MNVGHCVAQTRSSGGGDKIVFTLKWGKCETEGEETGHSGHLHLPCEGVNHLNTHKPEPSCADSYSCDNERVTAHWTQDLAK